MFDTLKYSKALEAVGVTRDQAEAHIKIIAEIVEDDLATKQDIQRLEDKLLQLEYRLVIKLTAIMVSVVTFAIAITAAITKLL